MNLVAKAPGPSLRQWPAVETVLLFVEETELPEQT